MRVIDRSVRTSSADDLAVVPDRGEEEPVPSSGPRQPPARGLSAALARWREELTGLGGPSPLLGPGDLHADALDLGHAYPSGIASFLAGRATRLSHLFREESALDDARRRARSIRLASHALADEHGLHACVLAVGLASWRDATGVVVSTPVLLRPLELAPDPEPMIRGECAHEVLERALSRLAAGGAPRPLGPADLPEARRLAHEAIAELVETFRLSPNPERAM